MSRLLSLIGVLFLMCSLVACAEEPVQQPSVMMGEASRSPGFYLSDGGMKFEACSVPGGGDDSMTVRVKATRPSENVTSFRAFWASGPNRPGNGYVSATFEGKNEAAVELTEVPGHATITVIWQIGKAGEIPQEESVSVDLKSCSS